MRHTAKPMSLSNWKSIMQYEDEILEDCDVEDLEEEKYNEEYHSATSMESLGLWYRDFM